METNRFIEKKYHIKASLDWVSWSNSKQKHQNNILLIRTLVFTPYVTSFDVLATSLNFNKNPNVLYLSLLRVRITDQNSDVMNDQW